MTADPDVNLLETGFESFLVAAEEIIGGVRCRNVDDYSQEPVFENSSAVKPRAKRQRQVCRSGRKSLSQFQVGLIEFCRLDGSTIVIAQW